MMRGGEKPVGFQILMKNDPLIESAEFILGMVGFFCRHVAVRRGCPGFAREAQVEKHLLIESAEFIARRLSSRADSSGYTPDRVLTGQPEEMDDASRGAGGDQCTSMIRERRLQADRQRRRISGNPRSDHVNRGRGRSRQCDECSHASLLGDPSVVTEENRSRGSNA